MFQQNVPWFHEIPVQVQGQNITKIFHLHAQGKQAADIRNHSDRVSIFIAFFHDLNQFLLCKGGQSNNKISHMHMAADFFSI